MSTKNTFYPEENFNLLDTQNLSLYIEVGFRCFNACVIDEKAQSIVYAERIMFNTLTELNSSSKLLSHSFEKVTVAIVNSDFTLVPDAIFNPENSSDYLTLNLGDNSNKIERHQEVTDLNCVNNFRLESEIISFFEERFKNVSFLHASTAFLNMVNVQKPKSNQLVVNVYENHFLICYFKNHELNLLNSFEFKTETDLIYLLLFLSKELELDQKKTELIISGNQKYNNSLSEYFTSVNQNKLEIIKDSVVRKTTQVISL